MLLSSTEGDDKPGKYPKMFRTSHALVITKLDLLPHVPFSLDAATEDARRIQPALEILSVCALDGRGVEGWCQYLVERRDHLLSQLPNHARR